MTIISVKNIVGETFNMNLLSDTPQTVMECNTYLLVFLFPLHDIMGANIVLFTFTFDTLVISYFAYFMMHQSESSTF